MTDDVTARLAEIEQRANAATAGPWSTHDTHLLVGGHSAVVFRGPRPSDGSANDQVLLTWLPTFQPDPWGQAFNVWNDAEFIAHARADVPWLLARIELAQDVLRDATPSEEREAQGTHSPNCHQYHISCLVSMLRRVLGSEVAS